MPLDLSSEYRLIVREILRHHAPDREIWAFGSRVRGTARTVSDLNLCILGDESLGFEPLARLRDEFSTSALPFLVDVVEWASTAAAFRRVIEKEKVVVQSVTTEVEFDTSILKEMCGFVMDCPPLTPAPSARSRFDPFSLKK